MPTGCLQKGIRIQPFLNSLAHAKSAIWLHLVVPLALIALVLAFQFRQVEEGRVQQLERSRLNAQDLGSTLASGISGSFQNIDLTLQAATDHIREWNRYKHQPEAEMVQTLHDLQARVPLLVLLRATNAAGDTILTSAEDKFTSVNVADRHYFQELKHNADAGMVISEPLMGRITKKWVLICARRYALSNGEFGGIVYASIELSGISDRLAGGRIILSGDDVVLLRDNDQNVIVRFANGTQDLERFGQKITSPNLDALDKSNAESGVYVATSALDQVQRSYYYQRIYNRPLSLVVGVSVRDGLSQWQSESDKAWRVVIILILVIALSAWLIFRVRLRQLQAITELQNTQSALEQSNQELARLSTTDSLTGLANRRKFEEVSAHEWQRALRKQEPLTVAMVDVDFFKIYNDLYGHQAGDQCLKMVAKTLAAGLRDGSDFVARYGGEEFIILLPGQDAEGAYDVLDRLRRDIAAMKLTHSGSKFLSVITFSVGFAVIIPQQGKTLVELIGQADQNLYVAKRNGKNQVVGTCVE